MLLEKMLPKAPVNADAYARDALQALLDESEFDESQLRGYVMGVGYR